MQCTRRELAKETARNCGDHRLTNDHIPKI